MSHSENDKQLLNTLLGTTNSMQMVSLVSQKPDKELDELEQFAERKLETANDDLADTLRDRLALLRSVREQQSEVIYLRFEGANNTEQLESFAFELEESALNRLERIVNAKISGAPPETAVLLSDKLRQVLVLRRELKPLKDALFRFLAADSLTEARDILLDQADLLLTEGAKHELSLVDSRDQAVRKRLETRKRLWRQVYGEHIGQPVDDPMPLDEPQAEVEEETEVPQPAVDTPPDEEAPAAPLPTDAVEDVEDADKLMTEVYDLLDQAIGNAMVAFGIYRQHKSNRADEALKLLTGIHKETRNNH